YQTKIGAGTRSALDEAAATVADFALIDKRAREYLKAGQALMAADVIFSESEKASAIAKQQIESARVAEYEAVDANEAGARKLEVMVAGGAAGLVGLVALVLAFTGGTAVSAERAPGESLGIGHAVPAAPAPPNDEVGPVRVIPQRSAPLKAAADLATEFGRVRDSAELERLLGRTAE